MVAGQRLEHFQVAEREAVHPHVSPFVEAGERADVAQRRVLRHFQIIEDGARGGYAQREIFYAIAFKGGHAQLAADFLPGRFRDERPRIERRDARLRAETLPETVGERLLHEHFLGRQRAQQHIHVFIRSLGHLEGASRNVEQGQAGLLAGEGTGGQPVVFAGREQVVVIGHAGRHQFGDAALHELLGQARVFELVADGRLEAGLHEAGKIVVDGVVGDTRHLDESAVARRLAGQHQTEHAARRDGVLAIGLIEIADPVEQDRSGVLRLDVKILLEHRRQRRVFLFHRRQKYRKNRCRMLSL